VSALEELWALADDGVRDALEPTLSALGAIVPLRRRRDRFLGAWPGAESFRILQGSEIRTVHGRWLRDARPRLGPGIAERVDALPGITPDQVGAAGAHRRALCDHLRASYRGQVLAVPTTPAPAPLRGATAEELAGARSRVMACTSIASLAGLPQVSIPAGTAGGAPVGLSLIGPRGADHALLDLAVRVTT
jgi:amidase